MFADPARSTRWPWRSRKANTRHARFVSRGFAGTTGLRMHRGAAARWRCCMASATPSPGRSWTIALRRVAEVQPEAWTGLIPGAGHWVAYEAAESFNAMLLDMLRRRIGRIGKATMTHQAITLGRRALLAGAALAATPARAQWAPPRQVRLVVPFTPGGGADTTARLFAPSFSSFLGQPAVVENRPGGGGTIGAQEVARAAPDGTTLLVDAANQAVAPFIFRNLAFDYATAFTPISRVTVYPLIPVVKADSNTGPR